MKFSRMSQLTHNDTFDGDGLIDRTDYFYRPMPCMMTIPRLMDELDVEIARQRIDRNYLTNIASQMRGLDGSFRLRRR